MIRGEVMAGKTAIFCICVMVCGMAGAQPVTITGKHSSYAGKTVRVTIPGNPFIHSPRYSEEVRCNPEGVFNVVLDAQENDAVRLESGIYSSILYVTPGCRYEIVLPEFREVEYADRMSPYYQPLELPPRIISVTVARREPGSPGDGEIQGGEVRMCMDGRLNEKIAAFDSIFSALNEEVVMDRRLEKDPGADSLIAATEARYSSDPSGFFSDYRRYRYGILKLNEGKTGLEEISLAYLGPGIRESNPAFMELFRAMFRDFLFYYSRTPEGEGIRDQINRARRPDTLRQKLMDHPAVWSDTLAEMVLLQELTDIFYRGDYHQEAILILLDSMIQDPVSPQQALYASQVLSRLESLVTGHSPPPVEFPGPDGDPFSLQDFRGKYVYLLFCTPDHYGCMMEYPFLQSYYNKHSAYLEVISVMVAQDREQVSAFMEKNAYGWTALYYEDRPGILADYMVRAFPTAYLIGR
ncbi:MAG: TlpA family protein disulfide reductase, partial [Bacteroidetes bacterium]